MWRDEQLNSIRITLAAIMFSLPRFVSDLLITQKPIYLASSPHIAERKEAGCLVKAKFC